MTPLVQQQITVEKEEVKGMSQPKTQITHYKRYQISIFISTWIKTMQIYYYSFTIVCDLIKSIPLFIDALTLVYPMNNMGNDIIS